MSLRWLLYTQAAATLFLVGLIWFVQIVHYPLFAEVARLGTSARFSEYELRHTNLTTFVVGPAMLAELVCAGILTFLRPASVPEWTVWAGLALVVAIWFSTACLQVPRHAQLARGFDAAAHRGLVFTNWVRTIAWSLRGVLVLWMIHRGLGG